jgi:hypothetical protein
MADFHDLQGMSDDLVCRAVGAIEHRARSILRHWYAGCALAGLCASPSYSDMTFGDAARNALKQADAVLSRIDAEQKGARP